MNTIQALQNIRNDSRDITRLAREELSDLLMYLSGPKFFTDTTVQVKDVLNRLAELRSLLADLEQTLNQNPARMRPVFKDGERVTFKIRSFGTEHTGTIEDTSVTRERWAGDVVVRSTDGERYFFMRQTAHEHIKHIKAVAQEVA
jgi:hypothetical protein